MWRCESMHVSWKVIVIYGRHRNVIKRKQCSVIKAEVSSKQNTLAKESVLRGLSSVNDSGQREAHRQTLQCEDVQSFTPHTQCAMSTGWFKCAHAHTVTYRGCVCVCVMCVQETQRKVVRHGENKCSCTCLSESPCGPLTEKIQSFHHVAVNTHLISRCREQGVSQTHQKRPFCSLNALIWRYRKSMAILQPSAGLDFNTNCEQVAHTFCGVKRN